MNATCIDTPVCMLAPLAGDPVWVKVVEVEEGGERGPKVGCSMKLVSQSDGEDLDPGGSK